MFYIFNLFVVFVYYWIIKISCVTDAQAKKVFALVVGIHAVLLRALANPYNYTDTETYSRAFDYIRSLNFKDAVCNVNVYTAWGQGYVALNWLIGNLTHEFQYLYVVLAILSVAPVIWFHYKASYSMILSLSMYFTYPMMYIMGFGVLRQHLAVGICLLALYNIYNIRKSLPIAFIAILCHTSAIIFIPFYLVRWFSGKEINLNKVLIIVLGGLTLSRFLLTMLIDTFTRYEDGHLGLVNESSNTLPAILMGGVVLLCFLCKTFSRVNKTLERDCLVFLVYGLLLSLVCIGLTGFGRLTIYNMYILPIILTIILKHSVGIQSLITKCFVVSFWILTIYLLSISTYSYDYIPYWSK